MVRNTKISWTHHTFNGWIGCAKKSEECAFCYAEVRDVRLEGGRHWGVSAERRVTSDANWRQPLVWNREAEAAGERQRVFAFSLADVGENRIDLVQPRTRLIQLIETTPNLDWLLLSKEPWNFLGLFPEWGDGSQAWPANVWVGTTIGLQKNLERRWDALCQVPARVRFISAEPLLGPLLLPTAGGVSWIITGAESGRHRRTMELEWVRSLRDQCQQQGIAFWFKQAFDEHAQKVELPELDGRRWQELPTPNLTCAAVRSVARSQGLEDSDGAEGAP